MNYDPNSPLFAWKRNVIDEFKGLTTEEIKSFLDERNNGFSVLMSHVTGDFNIGTVVRSANFHGAKEFFYFGKKRFDKRSCVGVHNYTSVNFLSTLEEVEELKSKYTLVGLENNVKNTVLIKDFEWKFDKPPCIVVGEECGGIEESLMNSCDFLVEIPNFGSIRSLNVGVAASIAMYDYVMKRTS